MSFARRRKLNVSVFLSVKMNENGINWKWLWKFTRGVYWIAYVFHIWSTIAPERHVFDIAMTIRLLSHKECHRMQRHPWMKTRTLSNRSIQTRPNRSNVSLHQLFDPWKSPTYTWCELLFHIYSPNWQIGRYTAKPSPVLLISRAPFLELNPFEWANERLPMNEIDNRNHGKGGQVDQVFRIKWFNS